MTKQVSVSSHGP